MQGVKFHHALLIAVVAVVMSSARVLAQAELEGREFIAYVVPKLDGGSLQANEHLLVFDKAIQIPNVRLSAGAYIFRLMGPSLLQVTDPTRARVYATFFVIPVYRRADDDGRERIKFLQTFDDAPRMVEWNIPGQTGYEFTYPKPKKPSVDRRSER